MYADSSKKTLSGELTVPGSKSCTIRAVLFGMLADGTTVIHNPLPSRDGLAALNAARAFGAQVTVDENANTWTVLGLNGRPNVPDNVIDTMNSGTTTSFVIGLCTLLTDGCAVITGDEQIRRRPWRHETDALKELGATCIHTRPNCDCPPFVVHGPIHGGTCHLPGFNSQHISGLLAPSALLPAGKHVDIEVENPLEALYVQLSVDWLKQFGVHVENSQDYKHYHVEGGQTFTACECTVPSDWSGVAFPLVAAVCTKSEVIISGVDFSDSQGDKEVVDVLIRMGADIEKDVEGNRLVVHGGKPLHGIQINMNLIPDSLPALSVAAAYAQGDTVFTDLAHVRVKETDRVAVMQELLTACGAQVDITSDTMAVHGGRPLTGMSVPSYGDHRVAMAMAVCGLLSDGEMRIQDAECADVSFPNFYKIMNRVGAGFELKEE